MRDLRKTRESYRKLVKDSVTNQYSFYPSDCNQIINMGLENGGSLTTIVFAALEVGFMIGYRAAKNDMKKRGKA